MSDFLSLFVGFIWNWPVTILCLFAGILFSVLFKFIQFKGFKHALQLVSGKYDNPDEKGEISHFQALSAALSGTIGLGNIAGVAIAISMGGPGAVFWMWIVGILGMSTKFIECTLGTHYRKIDLKGIVYGGPMYYIKKGLPKSLQSLSIVYAILISVAALGAGCLFQVNQAALTLNTNFGIDNHISGIVILVLAGVVILGGIKRIGQVASKIVPFMCIVYILGALSICVLNYKLIPAAFYAIFTDAFTGSAAAGGLFGVIIMGVRRGIFSNEAGLGSAAIAHSAVKTDYPVREGIVASLGPFIDTIIVCTATALVIVLTGSFGTYKYQNTTELLYDFQEVDSSMTMGNLWSITSEDIPKNSDVLRPFTNNNVLQYINYSNRHQSFKMKIESPEDLMRLSYFKKAGDVIFNIYDFRNSLITQVYSNGYIPDPTEEIKFSNYSFENKWDSLIIDMSNYKADALLDTEELSKQEIEKLILESSTFYLEILPVGEAVEWYFDNLEPVKAYDGIDLTTHSFDKFFKGFGSYFIAISVIFFAFSTLITWSYYGSTGVYFFGGKYLSFLYKILFVGLIYIGATQKSDDILNFTDASVGLLVIPNLIALLLLYPKVRQWSNDYFQKLANNEFETYK